ncbi:arsenic transporter [Terrisporobacter othiniensis]|uniref:Arsenic transporter n=1 Tax=Terrisporobacter othiniensis TaxID=1577792 RepID=A0A0B3W7Y5_9FIRM|nr:arsenic transporter [Terrisporobacter othiniensis]
MEIIKDSKKKNAFIEFLKKESVLVIALSLATISCFIATPKLSYIDFKVLILLFNLMIVVAAFKELSVLDSIAISLLKKCKSYRAISTILVFITFISAMIVTNDVALLTFVPLSIVVARKANINVLKIVIFQTLAANLGSSFTPMGNPQNLFIYSFYNLKPVDFFVITGPILLLSIAFLLLLINRDKKMDLSIDLKDVKIDNKNHIFIFTVLFLIILLSVFHLIDYKLTFVVTVLTVLVLNKKLFSQVDFSLLITFIGFFIFVGNISTLDSVETFMESLLKSGKSTFITSILSSQVISNVPATMLLSGFTDHVKALLLGANIGGMGTLIASLASVISYKIYSSEFEGVNDKYLKAFTFYNVLGLLIITPLAYLFLI